jgi:hypothetical protein
MRCTRMVTTAFDLFATAPLGTSQGNFNDLKSVGFQDDMLWLTASFS